MSPTPGSSGSSPAKNRRSRLSLTSHTGRVLRGLVKLCCARPRITLLLAVLLAGVSAAHTVRHLGFKTDQANLLPRSVLLQRYEEYERQFGDLDDIVIVVEAPSDLGASPGGVGAFIPWPPEPELRPSAVREDS